MERIGEADAVMEGLSQAMRDVLVKLIATQRGGTTFTDQMQIPEVSHTFGGTPDAEESVDISGLMLDQAPNRILMTESDNGGFMYASDVASWTATTIKAKCTKAGTVVKFHAWRTDE